MLSVLTRLRARRSLLRDASWPPCLALTSAPPHIGFRCWADATRRIPRSVGADERPHKSAQPRTGRASSCGRTYNGRASFEQVKHAGGKMPGSDQSEEASTPDTVDRKIGRASCRERVWHRADGGRVQE